MFRWLFGDDDRELEEERRAKFQAESADILARFREVERRSVAAMVRIEESKATATKRYHNAMRDAMLAHNAMVRHPESERHDPALMQRVRLPSTLLPGKTVTSADYACLRCSAPLVEVEGRLHTHHCAPCGLAIRYMPTPKPDLFIWPDRLNFDTPTED